MSNYALQNELNTLELELNRAQQINRELLGELSTVTTGVNNAERELNDYNTKIRNTLEHCNNSINSSHQRVVDSVALQGEIEALYTRFKQVELANKKIRECNNKKYYDFAGYRTVRKIVQGIMDNLDVQMVSDRSITKAVETRHLQSPDYWLTCVLISIMAWRNDDRELADRAMERALKLDKKNSAVFFMLFNLRMKREEAALKWFYTYQECSFKGSDRRTFLMLFSLVSKTLSDHVDEATANEISSFIRKVINANMNTSGCREEETVSRICQYLDRMQPSVQLRYAALRKYCNESDRLTSVLMQAKNNINILDFILKTVHVPEEQKNTFLKNYVDELIAEPNRMEKDVYDEIAYNELVIRFEGDASAAKKQFEAEQTKKADDLNLVGEMVDWIYERDFREVNGQIRLNMFTLTKKLQQKAVEAHTEKYRSQRKTDCKVTVGEYSATVNFQREDAELNKINAFFCEKKEAELSTIRSAPAYIGFGVAAAALVGCFFAGFWLLVVTLGAAGYGVVRFLGNRSRAKQCERKCRESISATSETMKKLFAEFEQYNKELDEYDAYSDRIREAFAEF